MMTFKPTKAQLRVASAAMLVVAVLSVSLSLLMPIKPDVESAANSSQILPSTRLSTEPSQNEVDFSDLMDVALRRPLVDTHAATRPSIAGVDSTIGLKLIGTIVEPLHNYAIFTNEAGKTEVKSVGEKAGVADISKIAEDSVTLSVNGRSVVLHAIKPASIGGPGL